MKARERDWIMVRLKRTTHARLVQLGKKWQGIEYNGELPASADGAERASLDRIIGELLRRDDAHRRRSHRSIARKRDGKDARANGGAAGAVENGTGPTPA